MTFETTSYNSYSGIIVIPANVNYEQNTYSVTSIAENAFSVCNGLRSVIIPATVKSIGIAAFIGSSNLSFVHVLATTAPAIGYNAFKNTSVPYVLVPAGSKNNYIATWGSGYKIVEDGPLVTIHNASAGQFSQTVLDAGHSPLSGIARLKVSGQINDIDFMQLRTNFTGLIALDLSDAIVTDQVLPSGTFSGNTLLYSFKMPGNLVSIGASAFSGCTSLQDTLQLPSGLTTIGNSAFENCRLMVGELKLPNALTSIGRRAFSGCSRLSGKLDLPPLLTEIAPYSFANCTGLDGTLTFNGPITTIGEGAFLDCFRLTGSLILPNTVESTGNLAFSGCKGFNGELHISTSMKIMGSSTFYNCSGFVGNLVIPDAVTDMGSYTFTGCTGFDGSLIIGNSLTTTGQKTFFGCSNLTGTLVLPASLTSIGVEAFSGCSKLSGDLIISDGVTSIGAYAFMDCIGFADSLYLSEKLIFIGNSAFSGCNGLKGVLRIPLQVTTIEPNAFKDCSGFNTLLIERNMATLGDHAFSGCTGINKIAIARSVPPAVFANTFNGIPKETCRVVVPTGSSHTYQTTAIWSGFIYYSESDNPIASVPVTDDERINLYKVSGGWMLEGLTEGEEVSVYDLRGILLKKERPSGSSLFIKLYPGEIILLKVSDSVFKLVGK